MKKILLFSIITMLVIVGSAFSAGPVYSTSMSVLQDTLGPSNTLTVYGFIDHTIGQGTSSLSDLTLRYSAVGQTANPLTISSINYMSNIDNPSNLLLDGAFYATTTLAGMVDGTQYRVELLINNEVKSTAYFTYNEAIVTNDTLSIPYVNVVAGTLTADYSVYNLNPSWGQYSIDLYLPTMSGASVNLGTSKGGSTLIVPNGTTRSDTDTFVGGFTVNAANLLIAKMTTSNQTIATPVIYMFYVGDAPTIASSGSISLSTCTAKEEQSKECSFTVSNNGDYPSTYSVTANSDITNSVSFTNALIQPGSSATGTITLTASEGQNPSKQLTLNLMQGSTLLDTITETINVESRDLINQVIINDFEITPIDARPGDEITMSFRVSNTGDYTERVRVQYQIGDESIVTHGTTYTLSSGQSRSVSINFAAPDEEELQLTVNIIDRDEELLTFHAETIFIETFQYTPYIRWNNQYKYLIQGNDSTNSIRIRNDGNVDEFYDIRISSNFASLSQRVFLALTESEDITIPIIVSESVEQGTYEIEAEICSVTSQVCDTDDFTLTILELENFNSTITVNSGSELEDSEAGIFEVRVTNNEGETKEYSLSIGDFEGELQISPSSLTLLDGEEGMFYVFAQPSQRTSQEIGYQVYSGTDVIQNGNLSLSYGASGLAGFLTLSEAGSVGAVILGVAVIAGLVLVGVKYFNQSKVELKYWK